jgi:hypothetical protein
VHLSAARNTLDPELFQHPAIDVADDEDENLLQHFAQSNQFIEDG